MLGGAASSECILQYCGCCLSHLVIWTEDTLGIAVCTGQVVPDMHRLLEPEYKIRDAQESVASHACASLNVNGRRITKVNK